jgi:hypothetical protein
MPNTENTKKVYIGFRCEPELKDQMEKVSKNFGGMSVGAICRAALKNYLENVLIANKTKC